MADELPKRKRGRPSNAARAEYAALLAARAAGGVVAAAPAPVASPVAAAAKVKVKAAPAAAAAPAVFDPLAKRKRGRPSNAERAARAAALAEAGLPVPPVKTKPVVAAAAPKKRGRPTNAARGAALAAAQAAAKASLAAAAAVSAPAPAPVVVEAPAPAPVAVAAPAPAPVAVAAPAPVVVVAVPAPVVVAAPVVDKGPRGPAAAPTYAWSVRARSGGEEKRFVVQGSTMAEAGMRAQAALDARGGSWRLVALEELAESLG